MSRNVLLLFTESPAKAYSSSYFSTDPSEFGGAAQVVGVAESLWNVCAEAVRAQVSDATWRTTFEPAKAVSLEGNQLVLAVPSSLVRERFEGRYLALVRDTLADVTGQDYATTLAVVPGA